MANIIIATLFEKEPVMVSATRYGADIIYLIIDESPKKEQLEAFETIKKALGNALKLIIVKTKLYDIVDTAEKAVSIIDEHSEKDKIIIDITASRKTQSLGLLFAAYNRSNFIDKIVYISKEDKKTIELPKLSFDISDNQERLLKIIQEKKYTNLRKLAEKAKMSRAMLYRNLEDLRNIRLIENKEGFILTDAGRIARL